jgi:hypothetical protein
MGSKEDIHGQSMDVSADNSCTLFSRSWMLNSNFPPEKLPKNSKTAPFFGFAGTKGDGWYRECVKAHIMRIYME